MKNLFKLIMVPAVVFSLFLSGQAYVVQAAPEGKVTFLSAENLLGRWNAYQHTNLAHYKLEEQVMEKVADVSVENPNKLVPRLAVSWKVLDPLTWEVKLRKGVKFHDGTPFDAEDIKASIEYGTDAKKTLVGRFFPERVNVEIKDPYTVWLKTPKPNAALISTLLMLRIYSSEDIANPKKIDEIMNGTGPYKWVSYSEAEGVRLTAYLDYWGGVPKIKDVYFRYVGDETTRLSALLSGEAQIIDRVGPEQLMIVKKTKGAHVETIKTVENHWIHFHCAVPPFKDNVPLRQAICYAIDTQTIIDKILKGTAIPTHAHMSPSGLYYKEAPNAIRYNPKKAKQLLKEAGYPNGQGLPELEFITSIGFYPKTKEYGEFIIQNLKAIGVKARLRVMEVAAWNACIYIKDCGDFTDTGWFIPLTDPNAIFNMKFHSVGILNHISDTNLDKVIEKQSTIMNPTERQKYMQDTVIPALMHSVPSFPIYSALTITGISDKLKGFRTSAAGFFRIFDCTLEK